MWSSPVLRPPLWTVRLRRGRELIAAQSSGSAPAARRPTRLCDEVVVPQQERASRQGQQVAADVANYATGGAVVIHYPVQDGTDRDTRIGVATVRMAVPTGPGYGCGDTSVSGCGGVRHSATALRGLPVRRVSRSGSMSWPDVTIVDACVRRDGNGGSPTAVTDDDPTATDADRYTVAV